MSNFLDLNLDKNILKALEGLDYQTPTPIQALAIPIVLEGSDLIASAQTGTGKTAAFMLPILHKLLTAKRSRNPKTLILAPTRELAMQIAAVTQKYSKNLPQLKTVCIYGGAPYPPQKKELARPFDILVATPGRLLDHMEQGTIKLQDIEILVLDEADRMLDMGFIDDVEQIAAATPPTRQTLLFSATLDSSILKLSKKWQSNPKEIKLQPDNSSKENIEQRVYYVDNMGHKMRLLDHLLGTSNIKQAILFISTREAADSLAEELEEKGHLATALHGNMNQRQRAKAIAKLRKGTINILVATDVAARGIDIPALSHVINIDLPFQAEDYIHRIGRTGRAGATGVAITFSTYREEAMLTKINKLLVNPMVLHTVQGLEPQAKQNKSPAKKGKGFAKKPFQRNSQKSFNKKKKDNSFARYR